MFIHCSMESMKKLTLFYFLIFPFFLVYAQDPSLVTLESLFRQNKFAEVIRLAEEKKKLTAQEMLLTGQALFMMNEEEKALRYYDQALINGYKQPIVHFLKAQTLRYLGLYDRGKESARTYLKQQPKSSEGWYELGMNLYHLGDMAGADSAFLQAKTYLPLVPGAWYMHGHVAHFEKNFPLAEERFLEATTKIPATNPYLGNTWADLGRIYLHKGDHLSSQQAFLKALKLGVEDPNLVVRLFKSLTDSDNEERLDSVFDVLKTKLDQSDFPESWRTAAWLPVYAGPLDSMAPGRQFVIYRYIKTPIFPGDKYYGIEVQDKDKVVRSFVVEQLPRVGLSGPLYHLKERVEGKGLLVYDPGWMVPVLQVSEIKKIFMQVLRDELKPGVRNNQTIPAPDKSRRGGRR